MFKLLFGWLVESSSPQSDLDRYIASKNPTSVAEVDYWTREYDKQQFVWGRGL